jgi:SAM-dependent methyltransferase
MDMIDQNEMEREIERLSPFLYDISLPNGLRTVTTELARRVSLETTRLEDLVECVVEPVEHRIGSLEGLSVLEVACNCGGLSIEVARRGAGSVIGTDPVSRYIEQAEFLKHALAIDNVEFRQLGIDQSPDLGCFDVTIACGLLYHLENPVGSIRALAEATRKMMVVDTQVLLNTSSPIWNMSIQPPVGLSHELASTGLWRETAICQLKPSVEAVLQLLSFLGFSEVEVLPVNADHRTNTRATGAIRTFIASRD